MIKIITPFVFFLLLVISLRCVGLRPNPKYSEGASSEPNARESSGESSYKIRFNSGFEQRLALTIESYLGVPYKFGGMTADGMDCSGFVSLVFREAANLKLPHRTRSLFKMGRNVTPQRLKMGDLVFFERIENYGVSHVGIYIGEGKFAHASTSQGVVISDLAQNYYQERYVGAKRVYKN